MLSPLSLPSVLRSFTIWPAPVGQCHCHSTALFYWKISLLNLWCLMTDVSHLLKLSYRSFQLFEMSANMILEIILIFITFMLCCRMLFPWQYTILMATYATNSYSLTSVYNLTNSLLVLSPFFIFFHRFAAYGATKRSVVHLTKSLQVNAPFLYIIYKAIELYKIRNCCYPLMFIYVHVLLESTMWELCWDHNQYSSINFQ